jgi:molybdenum cofactor biosynthesis protein B
MGSCAVALLTVSANGSLASDDVGAHLIAHCRAANHRVVERDLVRDDQEAIELLADWVADLETDVVIVTGVGQRAFSVLSNYGQRVTGFSELALLSVSESLGSAALQLHADAVRTNGKLVIALAGSTEAMRVVVDCVVLPQLDGENRSVGDTVVRSADVPRHITTEQLMTFGDLPAITQPVSLMSPTHSKGRSIAAILAMVGAGAAAGLVFTATHRQRAAVPTASEEVAPQPTIALNTPPKLPAPSLHTTPTTTTRTATTSTATRTTTQPAKHRVKERPHATAVKHVAEELPASTRLFDACTEETCAATNYERECCTPYKNALSEVPGALDRALVAHAMSSIASAVDECADSGAQGSVKLFIRVKPDGSTSSVEIRESPDETLGSCVANAVRGAHFRATLRGGAFTKSFSF